MVYRGIVTIEKGVADIRTDLFGGRGDVRVWSLLQGPAEPFTAVLSCELAPGGSVGKHLQEQFPEIVLGVEGEGLAMVDDEPRPLNAGDAVFLPLGSVLSIANCSGEQPLRYLIIKVRG